MVADAIIVPSRGGRSRGALVLFHGRGADERDLFRCSTCSTERRLLGATARGRSRCRPAGYAGTRCGASAIRIPRPSTPPTRSSPAGSTDAGRARHPPGDGARRVLAGLGDGVRARARRARPRPRGILALSGFIPEVEGFQLDLGNAEAARRHRHGTHDPVISVEFGRDARATGSRDAGAVVTYRESPMPHTIDPAFMRELPAGSATRRVSRG